MAHLWRSSDCFCLMFSHSISCTHLSPLSEHCGWTSLYVSFSNPSAKVKRHGISSSNNAFFLWKKRNYLQINMWSRGRSLGMWQKNALRENLIKEKTNFQLFILDGWGRSVNPMDYAPILFVLAICKQNNFYRFFVSILQKLSWIITAYVSWQLRGDLS